MYTVENLLPLTIYRDKLEYKVTANLFDETFKRQSYNDTVQGDDVYVLEREDLKELKDEILKHICICAKEVFKYKNYEFYITNSWVNYNPANSVHTIHSHANSIFSGVFYIKLPQKYSSISFDRQPVTQLSLFSTEFVPANSQQWDLLVEENDIIIFPSTAMHQVKPVSGDRISLAFNVFARGTFGHDGGTNTLELK